MQKESMGGLRRRMSLRTAIAIGTLGVGGAGAGIGLITGQIASASTHHMVLAAKHHTNQVMLHGSIPFPSSELPESSAETDAPGGANDQSGAQILGGVHLNGPIHAPSSTDARGGANVQSGAQVQVGSQVQGASDASGSPDAGGDA